ncbi:TetR/AcrR family transcriptional regulator [Clostridium akagii]|uniref:TetR/AcrR family transcriptional regulator n=1 Tax=Clostridium akagii TaxID=91623 RepID=UPI001A9A51F2|nr:TetR/AcrR family transcriptional regulator [Clostridium akagii]
MNSAMKEFSQKGFKNASTDVIVNNASISKGALFYYFKNKKELFLFLYDYAINIIKNEILMKFNDDEKDIFARRLQASMLKIEILNKYPEIYQFTTVAYMEDSAEVKSELEIRNREIIAIGKGFLNEGIDTSKFKEDIDINSAIDIITWTIDGFTNKQMEKIKNIPFEKINLNELLEQMNTYLEMLKKSFYK